LTKNGPIDGLNVTRTRMYTSNVTIKIKSAKRYLKYHPIYNGGRKKLQDTQTRKMWWKHQNYSNTNKCLYM
jgi:hypothetical protein